MRATMHMAMMEASLPLGLRWGWDSFLWGFITWKCLRSSFPV